MPQIILGFSHHPNKLISRLAKWGMRGNYSHVMMLEPGGRRYIEASGTSKPPGVQIRDLSEFFASRPEWEFRTIEHPNPMTVWEIACSFEGADYDWWYWPAWVLRLPRLQDPDKFVCNELLMDACMLGGKTPFPHDIERTYTTPQDWYHVSQPLE
jgi:hypothetical protein